MARYNSSLASNSISGTATIGSPYNGAFTNLTGTAPYTVTLPSPVPFPGSNQTFYNATGGTVTLSTPAGVFTGTGGSNASTVLCYAGNVVSVTSDGTNYVVISEDGSALVATTGSFSGDVTMNGSAATVAITPQSLNISPVNSSTMNNVSIGGTTRGSGAFTSLAANAAVTFTGSTASTTTGTGTLVVTGGVGVSGQVTATTLSATNIYGTIQTAAQANITSTGDLTVPSLSVTNNIAVGASSASFATIDTYAQRGIEIVGTKENGTAPVLRLRETGSGLGAFEIRSNRQGATSGNYLAFGEGTSTFMVIRGDDDAGSTTTRGFVGIGTTSPSTLLHVAGSSIIANSTGISPDSYTNTVVAGGINFPGGWGISSGIGGNAGGAGKSWGMGHNGTNWYLGMGNNSANNTQLTYMQMTPARNILFVESSGGFIGIGKTDAPSTRIDLRGTSASASATIQIVGNSVSTLLLGQDSDGGVIRGQGGNNYLKFLVGGTADQAANGSGTETLRIVPSGISFYADHYPATNGGYNCGTSSNRWKNLYTNDLHLSNEGKEGGNSVDGTNGDWTIEEGSENLYITNNKTGKKYAFTLKEIE